jgi:hypothetical protein
LRLYLLLFKEKIRKKERKRERKRERKKERREMSDCAMPGFPWLLDTIKSCFKGQSLNFMCT